MPVPSPAALHVLYSSRYYGGVEAARFRTAIGTWLREVFRWQRARRLRRALGGLAGRRVLDIGCGRGQMLAWLQHWGAEVYGTELSQAAADEAARRLGPSSVVVNELAEAGFPDGWFDAVTVWHVLEHVLDPVALLREVARVVSPDGFVYVEVPNAGGWAARRLGRRWLGYDAPHHLVHFTPETLRLAGTKAGLVVVKDVHFSWEYSPVTLLQSLLNAWLGGEHMLFRALSHEQHDGNLLRRTKCWQVVVHAAAGIALMLPVLLWSVWLGCRREGDTVGMMFRRISRRREEAGEP
ncbi:MAG: class I SAM-dependent methyltransferase [Candidatus Omnitrophica bacterium]|nr:class I SAM-dependent methyltransferase [Candidatus Omnitrophota bacterium]